MNKQNVLKYSDSLASDYVVSLFAKKNLERILRFFCCLTQSVLLQSAAITETAVTGPLSLTIVQSDLKMPVSGLHLSHKTPQLQVWRSGGGEARVVVVFIRPMPSPGRPRLFGPSTCVERVR